MGIEDATLGRGLSHRIIEFGDRRENDACVSGRERAIADSGLRKRLHDHVHRMSSPCHGDIETRE